MNKGHGNEGDGTPENQKKEMGLPNWKTRNQQTIYFSYQSVRNVLSADKMENERELRRREWREV